MRLEPENIGCTLKERWSAGRTFLLLLIGLIVLSLVAVLLFDRESAGESLFGLTNLVGMTTASLLRGEGLTACTILMGTPGNTICFHGGRMPVPTLVVALLVRLLGDHFLPVAVAKTLLLLVPLELAILLVCARLVFVTDGRRRMTAVLLLLPFGITAFLADVVNLQVEEGYAYSLLALAAAVVLFGGTDRGWLRRNGLGEGVVFGVAVAGLYLSKSAMAPAAAVLLIAYLLGARGADVGQAPVGQTILGRSVMRRGVAGRGVALVLALAAPVSWAMWQRHATGRYSLGTSLDGLNLHKGNDAEFLLRYPPRPGRTLDGFDTELSAGMHFPDEWSFNDFHQRAAVDFIEGHPWLTARGEVRKAEMIFLSVRKVGSGESHGALLWIEIAGMIAFRVIFWAALGISVLAWMRGWGEMQREGAVYLLLAVAVALPYVAGFAYTRHVSVLIYPSVLLCCRALTGAARAC